MSESKPMSKPLRLVVGDKNKLIFSLYKGKLQISLLIADKESLDVRKTDNGVFINFPVPEGYETNILVFLATAVHVMARKMRKASRKKSSKAVDIDEILGSTKPEQKEESSEDIIGLME